MKKKFLFVFTFAAFVTLSTSTFAQTQTASPSALKIGTISLQELIVTMPEAAKADTMLQNFQKELQGTYIDMVKEYQTKDSTFRADSIKLSSTTKELKKGDLMRLAQQIQTFQQSVEENLQKKQQELLTPIRIAAAEAIQKYAAKRGYTHIIEKGAFYYLQPGDDILENVKKELGIKATAIANTGAKRK